MSTTLKTLRVGGWIACPACNGLPLNHSWCKSCGGYGKVLEFPKC